MNDAALAFPLGSALLESAAYPYLVALHLIGMALVVGPVAVFDLRVLGLARVLPVRPLARLTLPVAVIAMVVIVVPSGSLLFMAHAAPLLDSGAFLAKMGLLLLALVLAIVFHNGPYGTADTWQDAPGAPATARFIAAASVVNWLAVIVLGSRLVT